MYINYGQLDNSQVASNYPPTYDVFNAQRLFWCRVVIFLNRQLLTILFWSVVVADTAVDDPCYFITFQSCYLSPTYRIDIHKIFLTGYVKLKNEFHSHYITTDVKIHVKNEDLLSYISSVLQP